MMKITLNYTNPINPTIIKNCRKIKNLNEITSNHRLFYAYGYYPHQSLEWISTNCFIEIDNPIKFAKINSYRNSFKFINHHNFVICKKEYMEKFKLKFENCSNESAIDNVRNDIELSKGEPIYSEFIEHSGKGYIEFKTAKLDVFMNLFRKTKSSKLIYNG